MHQYDVIIIGSGLGGLECGAILSQEGYNVCVLEKNAQLGGASQTYTRHGYKLDTGIHYIGSLDEGQILNQCWRYLGIMDRIKLSRLDDECFDQIIFHDRSYSLAAGYERFVDTLIEAFPHEAEGIRRYAALVSEVGSSIGIETLRQGILSDGGARYFGYSAAGIIEDCVADITLRNVLAGNNLLYGGVRSHSTFYEHAMITHSYLEGAYRCLDGSMQIAEALADRIRACGGTIRTRAEVTRICVQDEAVSGVLVNGHEELRARYVISNAHPQATLPLVDPCRSIKRIYTSRIQSLHNSYGIFTLYMLMRPDSVPYLNRNVYIHLGDDAWYDKARDLGRLHSLMLSMQASSEHPDHATTVAIMTPMYIDEVAQWADTRPERRGEAYRQFKNRVSQQLLDQLRRYGLDMSPHALHMHTNTPLSYRDYTATPGGSAYGVLKDYRNPMVTLISPATKLAGLLFTGQNMNVHGAIGVTLTAIQTCSELLGQSYLTRKIGSY